MPKTAPATKTPVPALYTAQSIQALGAYPPHRCLKWTSEGQVCFMSKSAVYIMTPDHGINFDNESTIKSTPSKDDPSIGFFRTMIDTDQLTPTKWTEFSQSWASLSLGSIDNALTSVAISPNGLSPCGGCTVATLSSNMDVTLWMAKKNYLKGQWIKIFEVTPYILGMVEPETKEPAVASILQAQITSIEWTPRVDFGLTPSPCLDASLLILGSRAGYITFLRHQNGSPPEYIATLSVSEQWINHLSFDTWNVIAPMHYEGYLAYGASDGSVGLVKITQQLEEQSSSSFVPRYTIHVASEHGSPLVYESLGNAGISSLKWVQVLGRSSILVSSNPGLIKVFSASFESSATYWTGYRTLRLQNQKISRDASALHPVSGVSYLPRWDVLLVTLFDGSFHVVKDFSTDPHLAEIEPCNSIAPGEGMDIDGMPSSATDFMSSSALSKTSRKLFERIEKGNVDKNDMERINGAMSYDGGSCFMWTYEASRPSDFSYKQDSQRYSTIMVSQMWHDVDTDRICEDLSILLNSIKTESGFSPLHILRPFFLHFRDPKVLDGALSRLMAVILPVMNEEQDYSKKINLSPVVDQEVTGDLREHFRTSLATHLFGWDEMLSFRMRLSLADFAWKLVNDEKRRSECGEVAQVLLTAISLRISRTVLRHLIGVARTLTDAELLFASRVVLLCMLPGSPVDLSRESHELSAILQPILSTSSSSSSSSSSTVNVTLEETCPACGTMIPFENVATGRCSNGHSWTRCSVTTFILSTPWVRTCVGCCRKAFLPPSALDGEKGQKLPRAVDGWIVQELLEAVKKCLFCGNGFVMIL